MSLENWKTIFEYGSVGLLFATFVFGAGVVITTRKLNKIQAKELRQFQLKMESEQQKTAEAQKEAANAQLALRQYVNNVAAKEEAARLQIGRKVGPRYLSAPEKTKLKAQLSVFAGQSIDIIGFFATNDDERQHFAKSMYELFEDCGWHANLYWLGFSDAPIEGLRIDLYTGGQDASNAVAASNAIVNEMREVGVKIGDIISHPEVPRV